MSSTLHLTIRKEPGGLPTFCSFPLNWKSSGWLTLSSPSLVVKLLVLLWGASLAWSVQTRDPQQRAVEQESLGHFILLGVLSELDGCQHLCFRQEDGVRHMRSNFQIPCSPFSESGLGLSLPVVFLYQSSTRNPGWAYGAEQCVQTGVYEN